MAGRTALVTGAAQASTCRRSQGTPEEVGAAAAFLTSDEAGYVTGATRDVNGGLFMR